jgi:hypothetical protein
MTILGSLDVTKLFTENIFHPSEAPFMLWDAKKV